MGITNNRDAQFMLLAGFIIAIGLVITTVILNSIIFEINTATGAGSEPSKNEIINMIQITKDETRSAYRTANKAGGNIAANLTKQVKIFNSNLSKIYALHGEGVNVSWNVDNINTGSFANFTENGTIYGPSNWTVIENVKNSTITINISSITQTFIINVTNATKTWQINFTSKEFRTIDNNQIDANITFPYMIMFVNGSSASGNYSITGNTTNNLNFIRARDYVMSTTLTFSAGRMRANITIPVSVPW